MTADMRSCILPVLDLKGGQVVRGVGGRREDYQPIVSRWASASAPLTVARGLRRRFGFTQFYVADLGAICDHAPHTAEIDELLKDQFRIDLDCGLRTADDFPSIATTNCRVIAGLETLESPAELAPLVNHAGSGNVVFSLDLMQGRPLGNRHWPVSVAQIIDSVVASGVTTLIVLDLAAVGTGGGCPTLRLCREIRASYPDLGLITGGGVRSMRDVAEAVEAGVDRVLVASALHDGRID